jgi:hypothetical protein
MGSVHINEEVFYLFELLAHINDSDAFGMAPLGSMFNVSMGVARQELFGFWWPSIGCVLLAFMVVRLQVYPALESVLRLTAGLFLLPDKTSPWDDSLYFPVGRDGYACFGLPSLGGTRWVSPK